MKITELIKDLCSVLSEYGNIEVGVEDQQVENLHTKIASVVFERDIDDTHKDEYVLRLCDNNLRYRENGTTYYLYKKTKTGYEFNK